MNTSRMPIATSENSTSPSKVVPAALQELKSMPRMRRVLSLESGRYSRAPAAHKARHGPLGPPVA